MTSAVMTDPLARKLDSGNGDSTSGASPPSSSGASGSPKSPDFFRGFYAAEKMKPVVEHEPTFTGMVITGALQVLPIVGLFWFMTRGVTRMQQQLQSFSKEKGPFGDMAKQLKSMVDPMGTRDFKVTVKDTKFKDVIGVPEALDEVQQYVQFLKDPNKFTRLGGRLPKGCLLTGQPGTGKTMLAKAVAGEAGVPFYTCSGADFIEVYVGSGPKRVRDLFDTARRDTPAVIFVDEIDAIGSRGGHNSAGGVNGEENRTINQLLAELDGLQPQDALIVFAATNFPDNLDKALLREGRFDRKVEIPMPDRKAREDLFKHYLDKVVTGDPKGRLTGHIVPLKDGETLEVAEPDHTVNNLDMAKQLAGLTPGCSPATIAAIVNEASLAAAVKGNKYVRIDTLLPAIDDVLVGKKHRNRMSDEAAKRVALHEAGHTVVAWLLAQQSTVIKVSITPRGMAAGFTQQIGREALDHQTDMTFFTDICVMLAGRAAELTRHTNLTTGASDDFQRATKNAVNQFLAFGMSGRVGLLSFDYQRLDQGRMYQLCSETTQHAAEKEAAALVKAAWSVTQELLETNKAKLHAVADTLYEKKELLEDDLVKLLGPRPTDATVLHPLARAALDAFIKSSEGVELDEARLASQSSKMHQVGA